MTTGVFQMMQKMQKQTGSNNFISSQLKTLCQFLCNELSSTSNSVHFEALIALENCLTFGYNCSSIMDWSILC